MSSTNVVIGFVKKPFVVLGVSAGLSFVFAFVYVYFVKRPLREEDIERKNDYRGTTPELEDPNWIEIGRIKELYYYPLKSGRGKAIENCDFTDYGISVENHGFVTLKDRMFLVYSGKSGKFSTGRNYPNLLLVKISAVDEKSVRLEVDGMESLVFRLPEMQNDESMNQVECSMWWGEPLKCIDCGSEAASWISKFLTGKTDSDLRIGSAISKRRNILKGPWEKFTRVYKTLRNEDTGYFADIASYMLMNESSLGKLNEKLEKTVSFLQFRPNIVVTGCEAFNEDSWEWIKIGKSVLLRNVKPCPRCAMIRIDPESGTVNEQEPLKTLRSFREQTDPKRVEVDGKAPTFGIYCGLYRTGPVKIDDKVFIQRFSRSQTIL